MKSNLTYLYIVLLILAGWGMHSCKQPDFEPFIHEEAPDTATVALPDSASIAGIHQFILNPKCNIPACHDGTFEPDFRSPQSSYATLVYQSVVKNTSDTAYQYRVAPGDTGASILMHRILRNLPELQKMPATGDYLTELEVTSIVSWINAGAPDLFGDLPDGEPPVIDPDTTDTLVSPTARLIDFYLFDAADQRIPIDAS